MLRGDAGDNVILGRTGDDVPGGAGDVPTFSQIVRTDEVIEEENGGTDTLDQLNSGSAALYHRRRPFRLRKEGGNEITVSRITVSYLVPDLNNRVTYTGNHLKIWQAAPGDIFAFAGGFLNGNIDGGPETTL